MSSEEQALVDGIARSGHKVRITHGERVAVSLRGFPKVCFRAYTLRRALEELSGYVAFCEENGLKIGEYFDDRELV